MNRRVILLISIIVICIIVLIVYFYLRKHKTIKSIPIIHNPNKITPQPLPINNITPSQPLPINNITPSQPTIKPIKLPVKSTPMSNYRCPPNWSGSGTSNDPCVAKNAQCSPAVFYNQDGSWGGKYNSVYDLKRWSNNCNRIPDWPRILQEDSDKDYGCPSNWNGNGTINNPCINLGHSCSPANFYTNGGDFNNQRNYKTVFDLYKWADECNVNDWPNAKPAKQRISWGCPTNWSGDGTPQSPCWKSNHKNSPAVFYDENKHWKGGNYKSPYDLKRWASDSNIKNWPFK